ncbi:MAG: PaREP1 family protein [Vulcanisaeta sp.]
MNALERLIRIAEEDGIDIVDLVLQALPRRDPSEGVRLRIEIAEDYVREYEEYIKKGDPVQASEKLYKTAEECIKALAEKFDLPEHQQALREGRWYTYMLGKVAGRLSKILGDWVSNGWSNAYLLHVWGFHEGKFSIDDVITYADKIKEMVNETKRVVYQ